MSSQEQARVEQARERETHKQHLREQQIIAETFQKSSIRFKVPPEQVLQGLGSVTFDADGQPLNGGKPLAERLKDFAAVNPQSVAGSVDEIHDKGTSTVRSKADLKSVKDKSAYIEQFGELAFARLPATAPNVLPGVPTSYGDYLRLPMRERSRLVGEHGPDWLARLQRSASEQNRFDRLVGVPVGGRRS